METGRQGTLELSPEGIRLVRPAAERALNRLKIFPLPRVVLMPGSILPLHIFEPRYRAMLTDCRASDRVLALATRISETTDRSVRPAVHPVMGVGRIVFDQQLDDGRSIIIVQGVLRAQIVEELLVETPYRVVRARVLADEAATDDVGELATLRHLLARLAQQMKPDSGVHDLAGLCASEGDPGWLADVVGSALFSDTATRLRLLALQAPLTRLRLVNERLIAALRRCPSSPRESN